MSYLCGMIDRKGWEEFRSTGLVLIINQILHIFGWAIVFEVDKESGKVADIYPARVKFRGFDEKSTSDSYEKITKYMLDNVEYLNEEIKD